VRQTFDPGYTAGHVQRAADYLHALPGLLLVAPARIPRPDPPLGIVRRRGDHAHAVPALGQEQGHVAGIFADPGKLGSEVNPVDEETHAWTATDNSGKGVYRIEVYK